VSRRGYYIALELRIRILQGAPCDVLEPLVHDLEGAYRQVRVLRAMDFEVCALYLGLCAVGENARGSGLLSEYVKDYRNSKWTLPEVILSGLRSEELTRPTHRRSVSGQTRRQKAREMS
jgi:hypothetical protein